MRDLAAAPAECLERVVPHAAAVWKG